MKTHKERALNTARKVAFLAVNLVFVVNAESADFESVPALDCLLQPYEVVEVSSAMEGVIRKIHVDRNDEVRAGQLLVELDSDVEKTQVDLARTRAKLHTNIELRATELAFHERNLNRLQKLYKSDTISLHVKDQADTDAAAARLQLRNAEDSQRLAELELAKAEAVLALRSMRSPIDGVVIARNKLAGEFVEDQSILSLARLDPLKLEVVVPAELYGTIKSGMMIEIAPEHFGNESHKATVTLVDKVIDPTSGTFDVRAELPNPDYKIPSGLRCTALFLGEQPQEELVAQADQASATPEDDYSKDTLNDGQEPEPRNGHELLRTTDADHMNMPDTEQLSVPEPQQAAPHTAQQVAVQVTEEKVCSAVSESPVESYRVLANPRANNSATAELVRELTARGVSDHYVIASGKNKGSIGLGFYKHKEYAEDRLEELASLGFHAQISVASKVASNPGCKSSHQFAGSGVSPERQGQGAALPDDAHYDIRESGSSNAVYVTEKVTESECTVSPKDIVRKYRVIADPRANDANTRALANQLQAKGINEFYVIADGDHRGEIALGLYRQERYAQERLAEIAMLGFQVKMSVSAELKTESQCSGALRFAAADF